MKQPNKFEYTLEEIKKDFQSVIAKNLGLLSSRVIYEDINGDKYFINGFRRYYGKTIIDLMKLEIKSTPVEIEIPEELENEKE